MGKILAIDYGEKRIGLAITDETKTIAIPKPYIETQQREKLTNFIKQNDVIEILLGLPKSLSGKEAGAAKKVREFEKWLNEQLDVRVILVDERFTTKEVAREVKDRELIDSLVAQKMLARYLEQLE